MLEIIDMFHQLAEWQKTHRSDELSVHAIVVDFTDNLADGLWQAYLKRDEPEIRDWYLVRAEALALAVSMLLRLPEEDRKFFRDLFASIRAIIDPVRGAWDHYIDATIREMYDPEGC